MEYSDEIDEKEFMEIAEKTMKELEGKDLSRLNPEQAFFHLKTCAYQMKRKETGHFLSTLKYHKRILELARLIDVEKLDGEDQWIYHESILSTCEDLFDKNDDGTESVGRGGISEAEKRVLSIIKICEFPSPSFRIKPMERLILLYKAYRQQGIFCRYKIRYDQLPASLKYHEKALQTIKQLVEIKPNEEKSYQITRIEYASTHVEYLFHYEIMMNRKDKSIHGQRYQKLSSRELRRRKRKNLPYSAPQGLTVEEIQQRIRNHIKISRKILFDVLRKKKFFGGYDPTDITKIYTLLSRIYYHDNKFEKSIEYSDLGIKLVYETYGRNHPSLLVDLYDTKMRIYDKLGRPDLYLKIKKKLDRLECSGSNELVTGIPKELLQHINKMYTQKAKKMSNNNDKKEKKNKGKSSDVIHLKMKRFRSKCSNEKCKETERRKKKKFKVCGRCKQAKYCSVKCQKNDWEGGHKLFCKPYKDERKKD